METPVMVAVFLEENSRQSSGKCTNVEAKLRPRADGSAEDVAVRYSGGAPEQTSQGRPQLLAWSHCNGEQIKLRNDDAPFRGCVVVIILRNPPANFERKYQSVHERREPRLSGGGHAAACEGL